MYNSLRSKLHSNISLSPAFSKYYSGMTFPLSIFSFKGLFTHIISCILKVCIHEIFVVCIQIHFITPQIYI